MKKLIAVFLLVTLFGCNKTLSEKDKEEYTIKGKEIAQASFEALSSELMKQMKAGGPEQAIPFCNVQVSPIVNELSQKHNAKIKRTTNKIRNVKNKPTEREQQILQEYINKQNTEKLTPVVEKDKNGNVHFYAPIIIKEKCLVCHGTPGKELSIETNSLIKSLYPNDLATGYNDGDIRGIWSIEFN